MACFFAMLLAYPGAVAAGADAPGVEHYQKTVKPLLERYCFDCHGDGDKKGGVAFDGFGSDDNLLNQKELWFKVLKNVRAGIMPPAKQDQPTAEEKETLGQWIKRDAFGIDPANPDPGRITLRRLNRVEYRQTIQDLMGVDFKADEEFPPDDTGYGFDTIADVLTVSPLLLEKYMQAAETIVAQGVPDAAKVVKEHSIPGSRFRRDEDNDGKPDNPKPDDNDDDPRPGRGGDVRVLSFYKPAQVATLHKVDQPGTYHLTVDLNVRGEFDFDPGRCKLTFKVDDRELMGEEFGWQNGKTFKFDFDEKWEPGKRKLSFHLEPLTPPEKKKNSLDLRIASVQIKGPTEEQYRVRPKNFDRFFTKDVPASEGEQRDYAREVLTRFTTKAYRRPADARTLDRLVSIAADVYKAPGKKFEDGVRSAMVAVLASPRFLFRVEEPDPSSPPGEFPLVDEYALATRLSYFLWSSMPDDELMQLASRHELRANLAAQVKRMMADKRSENFIKNFPGQWLQARDVDGISIDERSVLARDSGEDKEMQRQQEERRKQFARLETLPEAERQKEFEKIRAQFRNGANRRRFGPPAVELNEELRRAMHRETEMFFEYVVRQDRSVLDFIDSDYTFLNARLAKHYGVAGVEGREMRRVELPKDSPRGGVLTQGSVLVVTSNPTRTSPVKRGLFILDNFLGTPTPPPPGDIPAFEEADKAFKDRDPTTREILQIHRDNALCRSCHARLDPLGLGFENFNALGMWRDTERKQPVDAAGKLVTGETFTGVKELKQILKTTRHTDFYHCLTEKLMTYALGRGLEYYDVEAVDQVVARLEKEDGKFSALIAGVIDSAPFQRKRTAPAAAPPPPAQAAAQ